MATYSKSLAETGKTYIVGQVRVKALNGGAVLHIQVKGPAGNRDYGYALDLSVPEEKAMTALGFAVSPTSKVSLAGTDKRYWVAQFRAREDGKVNMQTEKIPPFAGNREYGNAWEFVDRGFSNWLAQVVS